MTDAKTGPYTLVLANHSEIDQSNFLAVVFRTMLWAYAASQQPAKIDETMSAWEKAGGGPHLTRSYVELGGKLDRSFEQLPADGKSAEAAKTARAFEVLLEHLAVRPDAEIPTATLYWVAETFVKLGDARLADHGMSPEAEHDFTMAAKTYQRMAKTEKAASRTDAATTVPIRLARCLCRLGKYEESLAALAEILKVRNNLIDAQREAAAVYQAWGREKPSAYMLAIVGNDVERKDGGRIRLFWGWSGIAQRVQGNSAFQDVFYEARRNLAQCRLDYALTRKGSERETLLRLAEKDVLAVLRVRPDLGGEKWYSQYDALLRNIQTYLNMKEDQRGLKAAERNWAALESSPKK